MSASMRGNILKDCVLIRGVLMNNGHRSGAAVRRVDALQRSVVRRKVYARANRNSCDYFAVSCVHHNELLVSARYEQSIVLRIEREPGGLAARGGLVAGDNGDFLGIDHNDFVSVLEVLIDESSLRIGLNVFCKPAEWQSSAFFGN